MLKCIQYIGNEISGDIVYPLTMGNHSNNKGLKRFPGPLLTTQSRRKEKHEQIKNSCTLTYPLICSSVWFQQNGIPPIIAMTPVFS